MLKNLPQDFLDNLLKKERKPVQLCTFTIAGKHYFLSDIDIIVDSKRYKPWVESWGELVDNSSIESLFGGQTIGFRTCNLAIIKSAETSAFINALFNNGVENTKVSLYQWFVGMSGAPVLIDTFVVQDPISLSERSMLLELELVSPLAAGDRRLYPVKEMEELYPVVVGQAFNLPLIDMKTGASATLGQDLKYNQTGWVAFDIHENMPATGTLIIDEEKVHYSSKSDKQLKIDKRGVSGTVKRPHSPNALAVIVGTKFKYAVCCGAVASIDHIKSDGIAVTGGVPTVTTNPAFITFAQWPPNIGISNGRTHTPTPVEIPFLDENQATFEGLIGSGIPFFGTAATITSGFAGKYVHKIPVSSQVNSLYQVTAKVRYRVYGLAEGTKVRVMFGYSDSSILPTSLSHIISISQTELTQDQVAICEVQINCGKLSYNQLQNYTGTNWHFHMSFEIFGDGTNPPSATVILWEPLFIVDYSVVGTPPAIPQEKIRTFVNNVTCHAIASHGKNITPPALIKYLIQSYSNSVVDNADFTTEDARYKAKYYFLNGMFPSGIYLHEAIRIVLKEGLGRLRYNQGKIQFISYIDDNDSRIDYNMHEDNVYLRSKNIEHYSTDNIINNVTVSYGLQQDTGAYEGEVTKADSASISKFGRKDESRELALVSTSSVATKHVDQMLRVMSKSPEVMSFDTFLNAGYRLEKGDKVSVKSFLNSSHTITGNVLSITRKFGQGKNNQMNAVRVMLTGLSYTLTLNLSETIVVDGHLKLPRNIRLHESVIVDTTDIAFPRDLVLRLTESIVVDEKVYHGIFRTLTIPTETVVVDSVLNTGLCHGYGDCGYGVSPYGE